MVAPDRWMQESDEAFELALGGTRLKLPGAEALSLSLRADPLRLAQVLMNLIANAIRYTQGPVELSAERSGDMVLIDVSDHGSGIPQDKREQIFAPFKTQDLSGGRLPRGKGFGLAGVREMVGSMGASITVIDRRDGETGTCFRLTLPAGRA
jgi:signal transduction histidine kinase